MLSDIQEAIGKNQDAQVTVVGQLHNDSGFKIRVVDLDTCDSRLVAKWKKICRGHGYVAHVSVHLNEGYASIVCEKCSFIDKHLNKAIGFLLIVLIVRCVFLVQ